MRDRIRGLMQYAVGRGVVGYERLATGVAFDPFDAALYRDPYPSYRRLREADPIHRSRVLSGHVLTRYEDVLAALRDPRLSSDERKSPGFERDMRRRERLGLGGEADLIISMLRSDPPDHTRLRKLVSKAFTPRAIEQLGPRIESIVGELLGRMLERGEAELMADLASPLPVIVIAELIGVPVEDRERFKHWSQEVAQAVGFSTPEQDRASHRAGQELRAYFEEIAKERRGAPRDDLMSGLLAAEEEGDRLSPSELFATLELLLIAGNETTTNLIGNAIVSLLRAPDQLERLRADPDTIDEALEELLRFDSPVQATHRVALEDLEIGGVEIAKGGAVFPIIGAANRDPARFADPDVLDLSRADCAHLAFGNGRHFCLGSSLARLEARHALRALLERAPSLNFASDALQYRRNIILRGPERLPVRF